MRKTLVYYKGRAPSGRKSDWIMHEYRLQTTDLINGPSPQEEGWVVCRAFKKPSPSHHKQISFEPWNNNTTYNSCLRLDNTTHYNPPSFPTSTNNFELLNQSTNHDHQPQFLQDQPLSSMIHHSPFDQSKQMMELPSLDSPSISTSFKFPHPHLSNYEGSYLLPYMWYIKMEGGKEFQDYSRNSSNSSSTHTFECLIAT